MEIIYLIVGIVIGYYANAVLIRWSAFLSLKREALTKVMLASAFVSSKSADLSYISRLDRDLELMAVHAAGLGHGNLETSLRSVSKEVEDALNSGGQVAWPKRVQISKEKEQWLKTIGHAKATQFAFFLRSKIRAFYRFLQFP